MAMKCRGTKRDVDTLLFRLVLAEIIKGRNCPKKQLGDDKNRTGVNLLVSDGASRRVCFFASDMAFWKSGDADAKFILLADEAH